MALEIRWSSRSARTLEEICEYISNDSVIYASALASRIIQIVNALPEFPRSGRIVPEYMDETLREKIHRNYRIVYRIHKDAIEIVAICHGARLLNDVL